MILIPEIDSGSWNLQRFSEIHGLILSLDTLNRPILRYLKIGMFMDLNKRQFQNTRDDIA